MDKPVANPLGQGAGEQVWGAQELLLLWLLEAGGCQQSRAVSIITMFEGSESEVFPFPGLFTVTFACAGVGRQLLLLPPSSPWEIEGPREGRDQPFSAVLSPASFQLPQPPTSPAALFLSCPLWAPSLAPALLAPLLMAPSRMFDASHVLCLELCLCCL